MKKFLSVVLSLLVCSAAIGQKKPNAVLTLSNGKIEIGVLPDVGGLIVKASLSGQPSVLKSDSTLWNESPDQRPPLDPTVAPKPYYGHVAWVSPQADWWQFQDQVPSLKTRKADWPPDPYLAFAPYKVIKKSKNSITLESPESKFTHVKFTKTYRLDKNKVYIDVVAKNISKDTMSWGLWQNTRMSGWDVVFVKADTTERRPPMRPFQGKDRKPQLISHDGFYSYNAIPLEGKGNYRNKSVFDVKKPLVAGFHANQWLIITSNEIDPKLIHPNQGRVELYIENSSTPEKDIQELELQFDYHKMAPGASISAHETWELIKGTGLTAKSDLLNELKKILK